MKGMKGNEMFISMEKLDCYESVGNRSFGNELFQYAALKIYAKEWGWHVEIPEKWIGRQLFEGCDDPVLSKSPRPHIDLVGNESVPIWENKELKPNCDVYGYFQYHTSHYAKHKEFFKSLFVPRKKLRDQVEHLLKTDGPLICIHVRRGDYNLPPNRVAPNEWYTDWLDENL